MAGLSGETLARRLLRLDAAYCAAGGVLTLILFAPLARVLGAHEVMLAGAGAGAIAWAYVLARLARAASWRTVVAAVAAANAGAAAAIAAVGATSPQIGSRLLLFAVALEVSAFAAAQLTALAR